MTFFKRERGTISRLLNQNNRKNIKPENSKLIVSSKCNVLWSSLLKATAYLDICPTHSRLHTHTHTVTDVITTGFCFNPCRHLQRQIRGLVMKRQRQREKEMETETKKWGRAVHVELNSSELWLNGLSTLFHTWGNSSPMVDVQYYK